MTKKTGLLWCAVLAVLLWILPARALAAETELEQDLLNACIYGEKVDLSRYEITWEELDAVFREMMNDGRLPWYTTSGYSYGYDQETNLIISFEPESLDEQQYDRSAYEQRLDEILAQTVYDGMSQWQIALSVHDYLAVHCAYDEGLTRNTGYDLLMDGSAVCAGYAEAYQELLIRAGVPCRTVTSEDMAHQWNLVCIDGQWYHVDVTWDDPVPDAQGYVSHDFFLLTDEEIAGGDQPHTEWDGEIACTDGAFSEAFWKNITSAVIYTDADTCYLVRARDWADDISVRNGAGEETVLYSCLDYYLDLGYGSYTYPHMGLSLWNGRLWFTDSRTVFSMAVDGSDVREEYTYDFASSGLHVFGCFVRDDTILITLRSHNDERTATTVALEPSDAHVHRYEETVVPATCTADGKTVYACACGITGESEIMKATGHDYQVSENKAATIFSDGYIRCVCSACGSAETEILPRIDGLQWARDNREGLTYIGIGVLGLVWLFRPNKDRRRKTRAGSRNVENE